MELAGPMGDLAFVWGVAPWYGEMREPPKGMWERRERMGRSALGCGNVWGLLARMGGARIWKSPGCMGAGKPAGCERHGGRIWSLWALTFFDANQGAPTGYGNGGPPEYMGSRMTWPPGRDLRTCGFLATSGGAAGVWGPSGTVASRGQGCCRFRSKPERFRPAPYIPLNDAKPCRRKDSTPRRACASGPVTSDTLIVREWGYAWIWNRAQAILASKSKKRKKKFF